MKGHVSLEEFIKGVHIYLWMNLYVGRDSYNEFTCIDGGIQIRSSHISMGEFI